jgi:hypothetical protein
MIKLFLKAKHWQLFLFILGIPVIFQVFIIFMIFSNIEINSTDKFVYTLLFFEFFPLIMIMFTSLFFGWLWSIVIGLKEKIPTEIKMNTKKFKFFFFFPLIYILIQLINMAGLFDGIRTFGLGIENWMVSVIIHLFSMF